MSRKLAYPVILLILLLSSWCTAQPQESVTNPTIAMDLDWEVGSWVPIWRIERFHSRTLDRQVGYYLHLTPDYESNPGRRYPVVYWLHGANGSPAGATPVVQRLDSGIKSSQAPAMILVS